MLVFYNTLTKRQEEFKPINPPKVGIYSCGPTVYDFSHIGHFRTYVGTDILRRVLKYFDYDVKQVMNITDVGHLTSDSDTGEDKLEKGARREGKSVWEIAKFYTEDFISATDKLNIIPPDIVCKATDHIQEMIDLVKKLEDRSFTYKINDGIYFDTSKDPNYGKLSGQKLDQQKAGARVEVVPGKKTSADFALWKFSPPESSGQKRQMEWDSPWGKGFPGWHLECSAMSTKYLGQPFDIHTGGIDHIPIHHTNEIAQSECAYNKPLANYWIHFNFLMVDNQKMSKSLGNIYSQNDILAKGFSLMELRYLFLTSHYRDVLNFTWESLEGAKTAYHNLKSIINNLHKSSQERLALSPDKLTKIQGFRQQFEGYLKSDLGIPSALAVCWQVAKSNIPSGDKLEMILDFDRVLGLKLGQVQSEEKENEIPRELIVLARKREKFRKEKRWGDADNVRQEIENAGYFIKDTNIGFEIKKK